MASPLDAVIDNCGTKESVLASFGVLSVDGFNGVKFASAEDFEKYATFIAEDWKQTYGRLVQGGILG